MSTDDTPQQPPQIPGDDKTLLAFREALTEYLRLMVSEIQNVRKLSDKTGMSQTPSPAFLSKRRTAKKNLTRLGVTEAFMEQLNDIASPSPEGMISEKEFADILAYLERIDNQKLKFLSGLFEAATNAEPNTDLIQATIQKTIILKQLGDEFTPPN
jgi:hypothetical protein